MALSSMDSVAPTGSADRPPLLSVVVKCYNEEKNIARCLDSILACTQSFPTEIVVADAKSGDRTAEIAAQYPIRLVQFENPADRGCGATAQLGWQFATGEYILLVDGDMEVLPDFLPAALAAMRADPQLGGVGGRLVEMSQAMEFQERLRRMRRLQDEKVKCVTGCGLYRAAAVRRTGYFMDRNLRSYEELDLGGRLRSEGWQLRLIDVDCVRHYGHSDDVLPLLLKRWRSRTLDGYGQFMRAAWGSRRWRDAVWICRFALFAISWWSVMLGLAIASLWSIVWLVPLLVIALAPPLAQLLRKRRVDRATYSVMLWQFAGAALIRGLFVPRIEPRTPFRAVLLKDLQPGSAAARAR